MGIKSFRAGSEAELLEFLISTSGIKRTVLKQHLKHGCVSVNGRIQTKFDFPLSAGDEVRVEPKSRPVTPALQFNIEIVYEDADLIVINKPAGLLTIATEKIQRETAIFAVNDYLNKKARGLRREKLVFIVHRLDRDVSGLLVLAKTEAAKLELQKNWGQFTKEYLAVVEGCPKERSGTISNYLQQNKILRVFSSTRPQSADAQGAVTHYEVLKPGEKYSLVKVRLETGRKHQIRVHLADLGSPVAGDKDYGAKTDPAGRIALHSWRLELTHPGTHKRLTFISPLAPILERLVS